MVRKRESDLPFSGIRVLDLADDKGFLCGKILGDVGADIIKVERPGGDPARNLGPFYQDITDPEKNLDWFAYNANKRGITLNIEVPEGQEIFKRLVENAEIVIESFPPGYMENLGLGYSTLSSINPQLVLTSITPFGQTGPYADYEASDIVVTALAGFMYIVGDPDRPPVRISFPQAFLHAGAEGAVGSSMALYHARLTGEGQQVDVSAQESTLWALLNAPIFWEIEGVNLRRAGVKRAGLAAGGAGVQCIWACKDGHVTFNLYGGTVGAGTNKALVDWMESEGLAPDFLREKDWAAWDWGLTTQEEFDCMAEPIGRFFLRHSRQELQEGALSRGMMLSPVSDIRDIMEDVQLSARNFWVEVEYPELDRTITHPGPFIKSTETACMIRHRAPLIGEHNEDIYIRELGFSKGELSDLKRNGII